MIELQADIWSFGEKAVIAITTNGSITGDGRTVPGRGVAKQAAEHFPEIRALLGAQIKAAGNHVHQILPGLVSFPVEETPYSQPDKKLIRQSAIELRQMADLKGWQQVVVPRPGCGGGGLSWLEVRPLLEDLFDDRFIVVSAPDSKK